MKKEVDAEEGKWENGRYRRKREKQGVRKTEKN